MDELLLLSKNNIPFIGAQVDIHQPTISEISLIGEENFLSGCQLLKFGKDQLSDADKKALADKSDFEIFMSIMNSKEKLKYRNCVMMVLALLFPTSAIKITNNEIVLVSSEKTARINEMNYDEFKNIVDAMFGLSGPDGAGEKYNPADSRAAKIAEKLKKGKQKAQQAKAGGEGKVAVFSRYVSILAVGEHKNINELMNYTVYQIRDEFKRFQMKQSFDAYMDARLAGAKDLEDVDNWMDDIHS
jgi:hypothetical protein